MPLYLVSPFLNAPMPPSVTIVYRFDYVPPWTSLLPSLYALSYTPCPYHLTFSSWCLSVMSSFCCCRPLSSTLFVFSSLYLPFSSHVDRNAKQLRNMKSGTIRFVQITLTTFTLKQSKDLWWYDTLVLTPINPPCGFWWWWFSVHYKDYVELVVAQLRSLP